MSEMIERVARAIQGCDSSAGATYEQAARAAIEAMREPTDAMVDCAVDAIDQIPTWANLEIVFAAHAAMINAALLEQQS